MASYQNLEYDVAYEKKKCFVDSYKCLSTECVHMAY